MHYQSFLRLLQIVCDLKDVMMVLHLESEHQVMKQW